MWQRQLFMMMWVGLVTAMVASGAEAQEQRVNFSIGGGFTAPNGEVRDRLGDGYNINVGLQVNVTPVIGIEGLYSFNGLGEKRISLPVSPTPGNGGVRPYGLVGMGVYYRPIEISTPGVGWVPGFCDPWWYICVPGGPVAVENVVGERSSTDFGMDFGGGLNVGVVYAEVRYHYIWGPTIEAPVASQDPTERKADGQFFQATFGFRF